MATIVVSSSSDLKTDSASPARSSLEFGLFIAINAVLFVRPADLIPALDGLPIYEFLIAACVAASLSRFVREISFRPSIEETTVCVLWLVAAVLMSHLSHFDFYRARISTVTFAKIAVYYLLFVTVVDSTVRLRRFCAWVVVFIFIVTTVALLQTHGIVDIASFEPVQDTDYDASTGSALSIVRLCASGIFHDPNDFSLILTIGTALAMYFLIERAAGAKRLVWSIMISAFAYALVLTRSRGGFLAATTSIVLLCLMRYGRSKTIILVLVALPVVATFASGRQTHLDLSQGTGHERIQLWRDGLDLLKGSPLFGIGMDQCAESIGLVAHNSFIHSFTELGLFGGTLFTGAFFFALRGLWSVRKLAAVDSTRPSVAGADEYDGRLGTYILAAACGYAVGLMSLTRVYNVPTYLVLGLAAAYLRVSSDLSQQYAPKATVRRLVFVGIATICAAHVFIRIAAVGS